MKAKKTVRVALDVMLTLMIVFEMFIQFTGEFLHEIVGFAFFASIILHLALSATWMKKTASSMKKGTMTGRRTALAIMGILLAIATIVLGVSSVAISGILADAGLVWTFGSYAVWATVHAFSSYALCALVVVHLAMHWVFLASAFRVPYDPSRRRAIGTSVHAVAAVGALALGLMAAREVFPGDMVSSTSDTSDTTGTSSEKAFQDGSISDLKSDSSSIDKTHSTNTASKSDSTVESNAESIEIDEPSTQYENPAVDTAASASDENTYTETIVEEYEPVASETPSASIADICTLCRKQCPLSAPRCNKPYEAGLI